MTGEKIYKSVLDYIRTDQRGNTLSPDEFNRLSEIVSKRVLAYYKKNFEITSDNTSSLGFLKVNNYRVALSSGVGSLPSNYYDIMGDPWYIDSNGKRRRVDVVASLEDSSREDDYSLTKATTTFPTCTIGGEDATRNLQIRVKPTTITSVNINYLRDTATPFMDYYINNTNLSLTYMSAGQSYSIPSGSTYRDGTAGAVTKSSQSVDWEWDLDSLPLIIVYFLEILGISIPDALIAQAGLTGKETIE